MINKNNEFLKSALTKDSRVMPTNEFFQWMEEQRKSVQVNINRIKFEELSNWGFDKTTQNLKHESGKFFSIEGLNIKTDWGSKKEWTQPIINQPEVGYLGIIAKKINGVLHFLMQAKIEPGNINYVQLSPTLQATKSNYTKVHKGNAPHYLEYFSKQRKDVKILLDQLQSEQGARFYKKRNRNIIIEVLNEVELKKGFCWLTLGQIQSLLDYDNLINMDTRTVISGISFGNYSFELLDFYKTIKTIEFQNDEYCTGLLLSAIENTGHLYNMEEIISWLTGLKSKYELHVRLVGLAKVKYWTKDDYSISHNDGKYFKVIAVKSEIENREVKSWTQPLIESAQEGLIAFIIKKINGIYHFLVQAKLEAGNLDILELAPTVQCLTGNYRKGLNEYEVPFIDYVLENSAYPNRVKYSTLQSEEGGRFYKEQNRNIIIEADDSFPIDVPENYKWMTLNQLKTFIKFNNYLNIQSRSLIAAMKFIK